MDCYSRHFKPLKETKTFHDAEIVNKKIHGNLLSPISACHSSVNENKGKSKLIKPDCVKFYWVRYECHCGRVGTAIEVLPALCWKMILRIIYVFEACLKWSKCMYILNASGKTWINESNIVKQLPFPNMTCYKYNTNLILSYD